MSRFCFVLVSALVYNLKFHYVCFKSNKSFGWGEMGNRNKSKVDNFFFFFTIVKYKFSLIPISCISRNPYIANNQVNFYATSSRLVALESGIIKFKVIERVYVCFTLHLFKL